MHPLFLPPTEVIYANAMARSAEIKREAAVPNASPPPWIWRS